jgi:hypothetical protein
METYVPNMMLLLPEKHPLYPTGHTDYPMNLEVQEPQRIPPYHITIKLYTLIPQQRKYPSHRIGLLLYHT